MPTDGFGIRVSTSVRVRLRPGRGVRCCDHLEQHHAEAVLISRRVGPLTPDLLWCHVGRRAQHGADRCHRLVGKAGKPKSVKTARRRSSSPNMTLPASGRGAPCPCHARNAEHRPTGERWRPSSRSASGRIVLDVVQKRPSGQVLDDYERMLAGRIKIDDPGNVGVSQLTPSHAPRAGSER